MQNSNKAWLSSLSGFFSGLILPLLANLISKYLFIRETNLDSDDVSG